MAAMQVMSVALFADRHADDAVAAALLAGDMNRMLMVQLMHLSVYLLISCFLLFDL